MHFLDFFDHRQRESQKRLKILGKVFERAGFEVEDKTDNRTDPYIFVYAQGKELEMDGVRVYPVGGEFAYRVQKEAHTHPYGRAYSLPVEAIFQDLMSDDDIKKEELGEKVAKTVVKEVKQFFEKTAEAEDDPDAKDHALAQIGVRIYGTPQSFANNG